MSRGGTTAYYSADGLGSVTTLEDVTGSVIAAYTYDSFGNLTSPEPALMNPFRYTGREWDQETSLYYYRARYYDPSTGRFLSEDPTELVSGTSLYAYVEDDPIDLYDPSGKQALPQPTPPPLGPVLVPSPSPTPTGGIPFFSWLGGATFFLLNPQQLNAGEDEQLAKIHQMQREYDAYKDECRPLVLPVNLDPCATLSRQIDHANRCIALRQAWDDKWMPGRHAQEIQNLLNRLQNLKDEHRKNCAKKCK